MGVMKAADDAKATAIRKGRASTFMAEAMARAIGTSRAAVALLDMALVSNEVRRKRAEQTAAGPKRPITVIICSAISTAAPVFAIAAPRGEDATHHYMWRFWRRLVPPDEKQVLIFDRSWYGRVMVERIEGFCTESEWRRAYREINEFERQLVDAGMVLAKFWIHISKEEQLARFEGRRDTPYKAWKLTDEDWRNRARWDDYKTAVNDMLLRTSTLTAPWTVVEGHDKWFARVKTLRTLVELLSRELDYRPTEPPVKKAKVRS